MTRPDENAIRDSLLQNLEIVEDGLVPVAREHYLRNDEGASGFLDILARDRCNRLVIIELKRTNAAAREAIQELFKYAALLRSKYLIREVEYRLLVIAVEWHELLIPFSEFVKNAAYEIAGGRVVLDDSGLPVSVEPVSPLATASQRKLAKRHFLWRFSNEDEADLATSKIARHMQRAGLSDFVLVKTRPSNSEISDKWFLYFAQQELTLSEYQALIRVQLDDEEYEEFMDGLEDLTEEEDRIGESADQVWLPGYDDLYDELNCETSEISNPEKASRWFAEGMQNEVHIFRHGRFTDQLISEETIISELIGHHGVSDVHLALTARTDSPPQMEALGDAVDNVFFFATSWRGTVNDLISYARRTGPAIITLKAFCNDDILRAIAGMAFGYPGFAPTFRLEIDRPGREAETFIGLPEWQPGSIHFSQIVQKYFDGDPFNYFLAYHFGEHRSLNHDIMNDLGLTNEVFRENEGVPERIRIQGSAVVPTTKPIHGSIASIISSNLEEVKQIVDMFMNHDQGFMQTIGEWINRDEGE